VDQKSSKTRTGIVQNSCITLMKGFDPLQMLTTVVRFSHEIVKILLSLTNVLDLFALFT